MRPRARDVEYHAHHGNGEFVVRSNLRHSNFDLYRTPDTHPQAEHWALFVEGDQRRYLTGHMMLRGRVILEERIDGLDQICVIANDGTSHHVDFMETAYDVSIGTNAEFDTDKLRLSYTSMVTPQTD